MTLLFFFHVRTTFPDFFLTLNDLTGAGVTLAGTAVGVAVWVAAGGLVCVGGLVTTGLGTGLGVGLVSGRSASVTYHINAGWSYHILVHPEIFSRNILNDKNKRFHFPEKLDSDDISYRQILEDILHIPAPISDANKLFVMSRIFELLFYLTDNGYSVIENKSKDDSPDKIYKIRY